MRHLYECPLRWADLDVLHHVNNVVYVDYLQEARVDMLRTHSPAGRPGLAGERPGEGLVVVGHDITYLTPLELRPEPVRIECWVTEVRAASFTMAYEIFDEVDGVRTTYARATTVLTPFLFAEERPRRLSAAEREVLARFHEPAEPAAPLLAATPAGEPAAVLPLQVRFSDVDVYGHVNNVKYLEYFQEARFRMMGELATEESGGRQVVVLARTQVEYRVPILFRPEPYEVRSWVTHVGSRSVRVESEIRDAGTLMSRAAVVLVFFDPVTQRSCEPDDSVRRMLQGLVGG
ncbi:acyl-CoA thioesterase [Nocardioides solisilvae]|uniref:acyl-CoA thioesterase n=1 Tax=Nocardioides solisilvae TaxID=1542435 RepID=UPI001EF58692|nr:thioesterase family protein [Nocardioides solisilvae]